MKPADSSVVFVFPIGLTLGGANTWSLGTARHLAERGWNTALIEHTCVQWHPPWNVQIPASIRRIPCPGPTPVDATEKDVPAFAHVYRKVLPAVMIPNYGAPVYAACAQLSMENPVAIRVIGVGHGHNEANQSLLHYYEPLIHIFLVKNSIMEADLKAKIPHRSTDIFMHPYVVDVPAALNRTYARPDEPLRLTYAGRITDHEKRVSNFIPLMKELDALGANFSLRIIGEGGYKNWLKKEISDLPTHLQQRVRVDPMMLPEELEAAWRETDICLLVSSTESGGISMLEAMAQGCVPVSTRTPGPSEIVKHGETGFLTPIDDMKEMARHIRRLDAERALVQEIGRKAYVSVRDSFTYNQYMPWFMNLVEEARKRPDRRWDPAKPLWPPFLQKSRMKLLHERWTHLVNTLGDSVKRLKRWLMDRLLDSRFYPNIYFSSSPFKVLEYSAMTNCVSPDKGDVILDLGCGAGLQTALLGRKARRIIGLDVSEGAIGRALSDIHLAKSAIHPEFLCSGLVEARFESELFDKIYSFCVLEHIPDHQLVLRECHRVLKPGGWMVLSVDSLATIDDPELKKKHTLNEKVIRYFTPQSLKEELLAAGFRDVDVWPVFCGKLAKKLFARGILNRFYYRYSETVVLSLLLRFDEMMSGRRQEGVFLIARCRK